MEHTGLDLQETAGLAAGLGWRSQRSVGRVLSHWRACLAGQERRMLGEYSRGQTAPCSDDPFPSLIICPSSNQQGEVNLKEAKGKVLSALMSHGKLLTVKHGNICMLSLLVFTICRGQARTAFWDVDGRLQTQQECGAASSSAEFLFDDENSNELQGTDNQMRKVWFGRDEDDEEKDEVKQRVSPDKSE
ncbi:hypothetical protein L3Q82_008410 [Scortum barcoo]|uniref:Uncharacterized protein n=1 Tax=Scortum barcoo TaxID=214431 RepID=A0ACB8XBD1_9TELE|nr:hypothetical protein L3Q82_008410 [Scortum barcoo]